MTAVWHSGCKFTLRKVLFCPAAKDPVPNSPKAPSNDQSRQKQLDKPSGVFSPDVSISSGETQSEQHSEGYRSAAAAPASKQKSAAEAAKQAEPSAQSKAKPKRGRAPKLAKQDAAMHAVPAERGVSNLNGSQSAEAEAAAAGEPKAKRKKAVYATQHALPLASANGSAGLHSAPDVAEVDVIGSESPQLQAAQAQSGKRATVQRPEELTCARARPWTEAWRRKPATSHVNAPAGVEEHQAQQVQAAVQPAPVHAPVTAAAAAADAAKVADSRGHMGSTGGPHVAHPEQDSSAQRAAGQDQSSLVQQQQPRHTTQPVVAHHQAPMQVLQPQHKQVAHAQQSRTSKPVDVRNSHEQLGNGSHGQTSSEHMAAAQDAAVDAGHTGESSGAGDMYIKSHMHAAPADAGQRSKSSHRGRHDKPAC